VNHYWGRTKTGGLFVPKNVIAFRQKVAESVRLARVTHALCKDVLLGDLQVLLYIFPPDKRIRDLDNILKSSLDALTHAFVWKDDSQISKLTIQRFPPAKPGYVRVQIITEDCHGTGI